MLAADKNTWFEIGREVGAGIPYWVQGAGANISLKSRSSMLIKASGWRLDRVSPAAGWVELRFDAWSSLPSEEATYDQLLTSSVSQAPAAKHRASMETGFHAALPGRWVLHFHSLVAVLLADQPNLVRRMEEELGVSAAVLPRVKPGLELCHRVAAQKTRPLFLLQGHGVILQMDESPLEEGSLWRKWTAMERNFAAEFGWEGLLSAPPQEPEKALPNLEEALKKRLLPDQLALHERVAAFRASWPRLEDQDCYEILLACGRLLKFSPGLPEWTESQASGIAELPAEKFRAALRGSGKGN